MHVVAIRARRLEEDPAQGPVSSGVARWIRERVDHIEEAREALAQQARGDVSLFGFPQDVQIGENALPRLQEELSGAAWVLLLVEPLLFTPFNRDVLLALEERLSAGGAGLVPVLLLTCDNPDLPGALRAGSLKASLDSQPLDLRGAASAPQSETARSLWQSLARRLAPRPPLAEPAPSGQTQEPTRPGRATLEQIGARVGELEGKLDQVLVLLQRLVDQGGPRALLMTPGDRKSVV